MSLLWFYLVIVYSGKLLERADTKTFLDQMCKITKLHEAFFLFFFALLPIIKGVYILNPPKNT